MKRTPVVSTTLQSVGYAAEDRILELEFVGGAVYQYFGVPGKVYTDLLRAESLGQYFNYRIKLGGFEFQKIV